MRSSIELGRAGLLTALTVALAGCGAVGGKNSGVRVAQAPATIAAAGIGPDADYPMVLGETYRIDGTAYTPVDVMSYDEVGYAALDGESSAGISVAHKTLPYPSYVEITALETGRTVLARVERRGPLRNDRLVALSPGASQQLGIAEGAPVRVRRTNPIEQERAALRAGRSAAERLETPASLLAVLKRKLPEQGASAPASVAAVGTLPPPPIREVPKKVATSSTPVSDAPAGGYPLKPIDTVPIAKSAPRVTGIARPVATPVRSQAAPSPASQPKPAPSGNFVVQAASFSSEANARRAAKALGGFVTEAGKYYRVQTGPFADRAAAQAALAKVRAAGYSDARVTTKG